MYEPMEKPLAPDTPKPASAWDRIRAREEAIRSDLAQLQIEHDKLNIWAVERIVKLESLVEEIMAALERAGIPRWPNGKPDA